MWQTQQSGDFDVPPAAIWRLYADPDSWPRWDAGIKRLTLDGPFAEGATGVLVPAGGPKVRYRLAEVVPERRFTDESRLPGMLLRGVHELEPLGPHGTRLTVTVTISGAMTWLFKRVIGSGIEKDGPETMRSLARMAATEGSSRVA
jgi:uncharacterized protein YndB with AHSA1/START domain